VPRCLARFDVRWQPVSGLKNPDIVHRIACFHTSTACFAE
jgi:hypothetical protein